MSALREIELAHERQVIKRVTSRESWREQDRTRDSNSIPPRRCSGRSIGRAE